MEGETKHILESLADNYRESEGLAAVVQLVNADFSNIDTHPSGMVTVHPLDAQVHPDTVSNELFEYMVVCKVRDPNHKLSDGDFAGKETLLNEQLPQYSQNPPRMYGVRPKEGRDLGTWEAELGPRGYAGIYKETVDARHTNYYVAVQASVPQACTEFKHLTFGSANKEAPTFQEMLYDPAYNFTRDLAKRNAERLAACVAQAVGVKIGMVEDVSARTSASYIARPLRAFGENGMSHVMSRIHPVAWNGNNYMGVFHRVCPSEHVLDESFVAAGPYEGITLFSMKDSPVKGLGLPLHTGMTVGCGASKKKTPLTEQEKERRRAGFATEGTEEGVDARLDPDSHRQVDDDFVKAMAAMGWKQKGVRNRRTLTPVIVKLADEKMERK